VLLAGYQSEKVETFCREVQAWLPKPLSIRISVEPSPAGTGGALWHARHLLDDRFLLINGDSWFDTNLAALFAASVHEPDTVGCVLLRSMEDCARYGSVKLEQNKIVEFGEKRSTSGPGIINGGMYLFTNKVFEFLQPKCSLEVDVLPALAKADLLAGQVLDGYFIDIGIPEDYARANRELPSRLNRPAIFFDRDGVINEDLGWVGSVDRFHWNQGAREALRFVNDLGLHVFLVTNQAGVARGLYSEEDVERVHEFAITELHSFGATIDDIRYCPDHPDAVIDRYRRVSDYRKPAPGMIVDLLAAWNADSNRSILIGDKESDIQAANAAGLQGYLFSGGDLLSFVKPLAEQLSESPEPPLVQRSR
jgi:D-glycero-D-manno-heptose 1,7-bisphosphate phosphatase